MAPEPTAPVSPAAPQPAPAPGASSTTATDFFLWLGAIAALYASVTAFIVLLFEYVNYAFPDPLDGYVDPLGGAVRASMATLIVGVPLTVILLRRIRLGITREPGKAHLWIRRWALMLTLFIAAATVAIDLVVIVNAFLSGELTTRFLLKAVVILLVAGGVFLHFLADARGYWIGHPRRASAVGIGFIAAALAAIVAGFVVVGTPGQIRMLRLDQQRAQDLQTLQYQLLNYWQTRQELPESLGGLEDPLAGFSVPADPVTGEAYEYQRTGDASFILCATFDAPSRSARSRSMVAPMVPGGLSDTFAHDAGRTCFERTIDPEAYPPFPRSAR